MDGELLLQISNDVSAIKESIKSISREIRDIKKDLDDIRMKTQMNENRINNIEGKLKGQKYITITVSTIVGTVSWVLGLLIGRLL